LKWDAKSFSSGYTIHQVHYRCSFLNIALLRNFNAKTNIKRRDNLGVIPKKIWGKVKTMEQLNTTKIDVETPWFPGFAKLMPLSWVFHIFRRPPRFSSDGDGASFPHQRWGFWALVSAKPAEKEASKNGAKICQDSQDGLKKMGSRFLRWVL
jgi:hypothetical protein